MQASQIAARIEAELSNFHLCTTASSSGSVYMHFVGSKVKQIRIANHKGHKLKRNVWEVRSDAMTSRSQFNRVYNVNAVNQLIRDFK